MVCSRIYDELFLLVAATPGNLSRKEEQRRSSVHSRLHEPLTGRVKELSLVKILKVHPQTIQNTVNGNLQLL